MILLLLKASYLSFLQIEAYWAIAHNNWLWVTMYAHRLNIPCINPLSPAVSSSSWYNRCLWKFPTWSFPTASCLCSLSRMCHRSYRLLACAVAERVRVVPHPTHTQHTHTHTHTHTTHYTLHKPHTHMQSTNLATRGQQTAAVRNDWLLM